MSLHLSTDEGGGGQRWLALCVLVCLAAWGCGDDQTSHFDVTVEAEDGSTTTLSDSIALADLPASPTSASLTPGIMRVSLAGEPPQMLEITLLTSEENGAPGVFPMIDSQQVVHYIGADSTVYTSSGPGFVVLDTCPTELDDMAAGTLDGVEVTDDSGQTKTVRGTFEVAVVSIQHDGQESPLHCQ